MTVMHTAEIRVSLSDSASSLLALLPYAAAGAWVFAGEAPSPPPPLSIVFGLVEHGRRSSHQATMAPAIACSSLADMPVNQHQPPYMHATDRTRTA